MLWLYTALIAALTLAIVSVTNKKMMENTSITSFTLTYSWFSALMYIPILLYYLPQASLTISLLAWTAFLISATANVFGILSFNTALKNGAISIVVPLSKLVPVFVAIIAWIALGESLTLLNTTGILIVTAGSYIVLLKQGEHILEPFKAFLSSIGAQMAVLSALMYSFASVADRYAAQNIHPPVYGFMILLSITLALTLYTSLFNRRKLVEAKQEAVDRIWHYLGIGIVVAVGFYAIMTAYSLAEATKVVPVIQIQVLINVIAGGYLFQEDDILRKLLGSLMIIGGVVLAIL